MKCDRCGKEMEFNDGSSLVGVALEVRILEYSNINEEHQEFYQKQLGKYEIGKKYMFCCECRIDSLMGVQAPTPHHPAQLSTSRPNGAASRFRELGGVSEVEVVGQREKILINNTQTHTWRSYGKEKLLHTIILVSTRTDIKEVQ